MDMQDRLIENAYSGVEYGLANYQEMQNGKVLELDLFDQQIFNQRYFDDPQQRAKFQQWLNALWFEKDQQLNELNQ